MAITNFIPEVWSESLLKNLDQSYVCVANCTREFEGEIKEKGSVVNICGIDNVLVRDYDRYQNIKAAEALGDYKATLRINIAKYFHFQIDDVDRAQAMPNYMEAALKNASRALAEAAEELVYAKCDCSENIYQAKAPVTPDTVIHEILTARTRFCELNKCIPNDLVLEVSPRVAALIVEAKINLLHDNRDSVENGYLGSVGGCKVYITNQITPYLNENDIWAHDCILRTKRAVAFAEQVSEVEAYRPELRFADAIKGLHLYGCEVIYPNEVFIVKLPVDRDGEQ